MKNHIYTLPKFKTITWEMTNYCNYNCSYCTPELNGGSIPLPKSFDHIIKLVKDFRQDKNLIFDIMGGEPTLWPKFKEFCFALKNTSDAETHIVFSTNASRTLRWWQQFDAPVSNLGLSFHPEEASVEHFIDVIKEMQHKNNVTVYIMCPPKNNEKSKKLLKEIIKNKFRVRALLKLVMDWGSGGKGLVAGYDDATLKLIADSNYKHPDCDLEPIDHTLYYNDNPIGVRQIINKNLNQFKGWSCKLGSDNLYVKANGNIQGSACGIHGSVLGNLDSGYELKTNPVICTREFCGCAADIEIEKWYTNTIE